jgi:hypothetical protein
MNFQRWNHVLSLWISLSDTSLSIYHLFQNPNAYCTPHSLYIMRLLYIVEYNTKIYWRSTQLSNLYWTILFFFGHVHICKTCQTWLASRQIKIWQLCARLIEFSVVLNKTKKPHIILYKVCYFYCVSPNSTTLRCTLTVKSLNKYR